MLAEFETSIAENGATGLLVAADVAEETETEYGYALAVALRTFANFHDRELTFEETVSLVEFNRVFQFADGSHYLNGHHQLRPFFLADRLGPYWTRLHVTERYFHDAMLIMSKHPIRKLHIHTTDFDGPFWLLLRNYRMENVVTLNVHCTRWNHMNWEILAESPLTSLRVMTLKGATRLRAAKIIANFLQHKKIRKGAVLKIENEEFVR